MYYKLIMKPNKEFQIEFKRATKKEVKTYGIGTVYFVSTQSGDGWAMVDQYNFVIAKTQKDCIGDMILHFQHEISKINTRTNNDLNFVRKVLEVLRDEIRCIEENEEALADGETNDEK